MKKLNKNLNLKKQEQTIFELNCDNFLGYPDGICDMMKTKDC